MYYAKGRTTVRGAVPVGTTTSEVARSRLANALRVLLLAFCLLIVCLMILAIAPSSSPRGAGLLEQICQTTGLQPARVMQLQCVLRTSDSGQAMAPGYATPTADRLPPSLPCPAPPPGPCPWLCSAMAAHSRHSAASGSARSNSATSISPGR
eukprot:CAMPEP_0181170460 /NCGR_PEP_ID=MMETSP1096-20121128/1378_1 /TAXON_ID=156174 ORGANISM="Chrysochromulina ericina, Strain CCMP281" /NCGR_SAMPLE_ID=MMETSP1096 /ASSEMBLY_ACC=CAM_ASM_000453 /LENGTH=151 /DNA_ID=CAMNT_0023258023 /DNA_START=26 /DNA_END=482 /DNA_ORIENTATION=-